MSDEPKKRPASQYYWGDWWKDKALQSCQLAARGLWHEMNTLMHEGEPYGHLTLNSKPMTPDQLANLCRITSKKCRQLIDELEAAGVFSRTENGAIYSRRMVRDEAVRNARAHGGMAGAEHGIKGAEHGALGGRPRKETGDAKPPLVTPLKPPPSSASSSSSSDRETPPATQGPPGSAGRLRPRSSKSGGMTFAEWADAEKTAGRRAMPADDPIFGYADKVGLPLEFLHLAWREFVARYTADPVKGEKQKTYTDWRAVFRKAVREGWLKLWYLEGQQYLLTTAGQQAQRVHQAPGEAVPQADTSRRQSRQEQRIAFMDALTGRDRKRASGQRAAMGDFVDVDARRVDGADADGPSNGLSSEQAIVPTEAPPPWR